METSEALLATYAATGSEPAFRELVERHGRLVYSAALRIVGGNSHIAEDVSQSVFADLARTAAKGRTSVAGWLYQHTCFVASKMVRSERRRQTREQMAATMANLDSQPDRMSAVLDDAVNRLRASDREAIVLRYFDRQDLRGVGAALGISEDAAEKRVSRAVEKLREVLGRRGVVSSNAALVEFLQRTPVEPSGEAASHWVRAGMEREVMAPSGAGILGSAWLWLGLGVAVLLAIWIASPGKVSETAAHRAAGNSQREEPGEISAGDARDRGVNIFAQRRAPRRAVSVPAITAEETPRQPAQIHVTVQYIRAPLAVVKALSPTLPTPGKPSGQILSEAAGEAWMKKLKEMPGVEILSSPRVTTLDGREASLSTGLDQAVTPTLTEWVGVKLDVIPVLAGGLMKLNYSVLSREFLGHEDSGTPKFRTFQFREERSIPSWGVYVMSLCAEEPSEHDRYLLVWMQAGEIDPAGNRVAPAEGEGEPPAQSTR